MAAITDMSAKTRTNWLIDLAVFLGGVFASISGIYFLFVPSGGYQGGRNLLYGTTILITRKQWDSLHMWAGIAMIAAVMVHFAIHWHWVKAMVKRIWRSMGPGRVRISQGARLNLGVDIVIAVSFLLTALSGVYFLYAPSGGFQGGANLGWDPGFLFSRMTWNLVHTWAGTVMIIAAVVHFIIHWGWVTKITRRLFLSLWPHLPVSNTSSNEIS